MSNKDQKKLVLVDGSSYLFRAYHALPPLTTTKGLPTGAIYGVINMLRKLLSEEKPDYMVVIFDTKSKNFRHTIYPEYKANRPEMDQELQVQIKPLHEVIVAMGLPLLAMEGIEADDVIGTLAHLASLQHIQTVVSTGDKDLAQLVNDNITLVNTMTGLVLDKKGVFEKFGVRPDQIIDYLTLVGDPVDNVPGIQKVGPKTAAKWLEEYGTLENLQAHAANIKGKVGEYFRAQLGQLPLSKQLVTVQRDVPLTAQVDSFSIQPKQMSALKALFTELEFKSWLKELGNDNEIDAPVESVPSAASKGNYITVWSETVFLKLLTDIRHKKWVVIDTETTGLDSLQAQLVGLSFSLAEEAGYYVPLAHDYLDCPKQLSRDWVLEQIKPILEDNEIGKIGQNLKYDMHIFARYGIHLQPVMDDTMLASYVINSTGTRHDMDSLAQYYLGYQTISFEDVAGKGAKQITFDKVDIERATEYASEDADITLRLQEVFSQKLKAIPQLEALYREVELPLVEVLCQMEEEGVKINVAALEKQSQYLAKELQILEEQAYILAGEEFNLGSPKQLQGIFYDKLKLPILEKTPKGAPSTAESVLQELSHDYELPRVLLTHRTLSKLKSTYVDKLPLQINSRTGRIHTSYQQAVTATGRLSSTDPNLQNIPIRTEEGRKIRQAFIANEGYSIVAADYSQIELRIMAHLSEDKGLLEAFKHGLDIHQYTASEVMGVELKDVTPEQRRNAKAINFGLIYGMSAFGLAKQLDIDRTSAQAYMAQYFERYPGVKLYMERIRNTATEKGYVETLLGRRLYLPDIQSKNVGRKRSAERAAINAPMQGTAADIIKKAMITIHQQIKHDSKIKMLMQVHDELVFEVAEDVIDKAKQFITHSMQHAMTLLVPLEVNVGVGKNWDEAH